MKEISKHARFDDCWTVIDGKVYDISDFMYDHPGGPYILLYRAAGKDASTDFHSQGHTSDAFDQLKKLEIGRIFSHCEDTSDDSNGSNSKSSMDENQVVDDDWQYFFDISQARKKRRLFYLLDDDDETNESKANTKKTNTKQAAVNEIDANQTDVNQTDVNQTVVYNGNVST